MLNNNDIEFYGIKFEYRDINSGRIWYCPQCHDQSPDIYIFYYVKQNNIYYYNNEPFHDISFLCPKCYNNIIRFIKGLLKRYEIIY